ncbi:MAG: hypothetical protein DRZ76_01950 [Candidatus Nealsonbacteria bacterium]|nr:MAG: hypothetical protein DRZ76_01950 [Candidatus Nealsonbacteria bacterium]
MNGTPLTPEYQEMLKLVPEIVEPAGIKPRKRALQAMAFRGLRGSPVEMYPLAEIERGLAEQVAKARYGIYETGAKLGWQERQRKETQEWQEEMYEKQMEDIKKMQEQAVMQQLIGSVLGPLAGVTGTGLAGGLLSLIPGVSEETPIEGTDIKLPGITPISMIRNYLSSLYGTIDPTTAAIYSMMFKGFQPQILSPEAT